MTPGGAIRRENNFEPGDHTWHICYPLHAGLSEQVEKKYL